jgi:hypothetical protein
MAQFLGFDGLRSLSSHQHKKEAPRVTLSIAGGTLEAEELPG